MKIFIDFDDVIFNTKQFKQDFKKLFLDSGVSGEIFDKYYNDPNDLRAIKSFDPWKQIRGVSKELNLDEGELARLVSEFISDISKYVFSDAPSFVEDLGSENIHIISFGEKEFQSKKIYNSKIDNILPSIAITEESKTKTIGELFESGIVDPNQKIFFLDDRIEQIREVKQNFPNITTLFVKRPEGRYQEMQKEDCCDHEVHNLDEARKLILKL